MAWSGVMIKFLTVKKDAGNIFEPIWHPIEAAKGKEFGLSGLIQP